MQILFLLLITKIALVQYTTLSSQEEQQHQSFQQNEKCWQPPAALVIMIGATEEVR